MNKYHIINCNKYNWMINIFIIFRHLKNWINLMNCSIIKTGSLAFIQQNSCFRLSGIDECGCIPAIDLRRRI